jgi:hypothetical protein
MQTKEEMREGMGKAAAWPNWLWQHVDAAVGDK